MFMYTIVTLMVILGLNIMDRNILDSLEKMPLDTAREEAIALIDVKKTKPVVLNRLKYDISVARNSQEVMRIMWAVYMSGSGHGTLGSFWKKHYNGM